MEFRDVTLENLVELSALKVTERQKGLVAENLYTIAQAGMVPDSLCRGIYVEDRPVGFIATQREPGHIYIWRFMIDAAHQGMGIGSEAMSLILAESFADPSTQLVDLGVQRRPGGAEPFYLKCGFTPTEEESDGDWRMKITRREYLFQFAGP